MANPLLSRCVARGWRRPVSDTEFASVGHHFIIGLRPPTALYRLDRQLLHDIRPAGIILFKSNFHHDRPYEEWLSSHADLIAAIREAVCRERVFVAIDR